MTTKLKTIEERWDEFTDHVGMPATLGTPMMMLLRRVFFAGWTDCLSALQKDIAPLPEDEGVRQMDEFHRQCKEFVDRINRNEA